MACFFICFLRSKPSTLDTSTIILINFLKYNNEIISKLIVNCNQTVYYEIKDYKYFITFGGVRFMSVIEVKDVNKMFGAFRALNELSMEVNQGEIYGFIGPNGAGKSTTIRILLGMLKPTSGSVSLFGRDAWKDAVDIHRRCAYVPGDVHVWPNLTGGEVIDLFLKMNGEFSTKKRDGWIERFQFDPSKKCRSYSKGNRQKIALISAFASEADLFIFDEPTSGLDPLMEQVFQQGVKEIRNAGKTVLLSSHILSEVEKLCDRVAIIRHGEIIEDGTIQELRHLTRMNIIVETKQPFKSIEAINGIHELRKEGSVVSFEVDTEYMDEVISYISSYGIIRLESKPPTLEHLFMRHYEQKGNKEEQS